MAEERAAFERDIESRRFDKKRIHQDRLQEFDLFTATAGLDLERIEIASEPASSVPSSSSLSASAVADVNSGPPIPLPRHDIPRLDNIKKESNILRSESSTTPRSSGPAITQQRPSSIIGAPSQFSRPIDEPSLEHSYAPALPPKASPVAAPRTSVRKPLPEPPLRARSTAALSQDPEVAFTDPQQSTRL